MAGVASLQAAYAPNLSTMETSKPWSVSLAVRGFYDDNPFTAPSGKTEPSFGVEVTPTFSLNMALEQTILSLNFAYSMRYYEARPDNNVDQSVVLGGKLEHAFSERSKVQVYDSFIYSQEPTVIDPNGIITNPFRTDGNNFHNIGGLTFNRQMTELLGLEVGYLNNFYDYQQNAADVVSPGNPLGIGSRSALLDRMEQLISLSLRYQVNPKLIGILGYQFGMTDYNSDELIFGPPTPITSEIKNNRAQYFFVGVDSTINDRMSGALRLGGRYTDYYNDPGADNKVTPYADGSLSYTYSPGSFLQLGVKVDKNATDQVGSNVANPTVDQQSAAVYASMTHRITAKLSGNLLGQFQTSRFEGGSLDGQRDNFYIFGAGLNYMISRHISADLTYSFNRLDSDLPDRSYSRNQVFLGIKGTY